jgi:hypothetical protein
MNSNRGWLGWIAIGLGALALLVALGGRGFGPQIAAGLGGANMQQGTGPQSGGFAPGANAQRGAGRPGSGPQNGRADPGASARRGPGRPGDGGFGLGGWFGFPFKLLGGSFQMSMLALLVVLGVWLFRRRTAGGAVGSQRAEPAHGPAPEPQTPTGESYTEEPRDQA